MTNQNEASRSRFASVLFPKTFWPLPPGGRWGRGRGGAAKLAPQTSPSAPGGKWPEGHAVAPREGWDGPRPQKRAAEFPYPTSPQIFRPRSSTRKSTTEARRSAASARPTDKGDVPGRLAEISDAVKR